MLFALAALAGDRAIAEDYTELSGSEFRMRLRNEFRAELVGDQTGQIVDQNDFDELLWLNFSTKGIGSPKLRTHFSGRFEDDLDNIEVLDEFADGRDARLPGAGYARIYEGYFQIQDVWSDVNLTGGRQAVDGVVWPVRMDGARVDINEIGPFSIAVFGGVNAGYRSSLPIRGIFGGQLAAEPAEWLRLEFSNVYHIENLFEVSLEGTLPERDFLGYFACVRLLDDDGDELRAGIDFEIWKTGTSFFIEYTKVLSGGRQVFFDPTSYFDRATRLLRVPRLFLPVLAPSNDYFISIEQDLTRRNSLSLEYRRHEIADRHETGFETSYHEASIGLANRGLIPHLSADAEFLWHDGDRSTRETPGFFDTFDEGETQYLEMNGGLSYRRGKVVFSWYGYYRIYDYVSQFVRFKGQEAWGTEIGVKWRVTDNTTFSLDYFFDDDLSEIAPDVKYTHAVFIGLEFKWGFSRRKP